MLVRRFARQFLNFIIPGTPLGDQIYATVDFCYRHRRLPRFENPVTFNDHLFRIRVCSKGESELRRLVADKIRVKDYISSTIGERYALSTVAILNTDQDIDDFAPPVPCVVKSSHTSGDVLIVRNEHDFDRALVKRYRRRDYYLQHREWFYKDARKRVLVEELFSEDGATPPDDFKVFCFAGVPKLIQVDHGRFTKHTRTLYTPDWRRMPVAYQYPADTAIARPHFLDELLEIAARMAEPFTFIRVDALAANGELKINELTNCPEAARGRFYPEGIDEKLGRLFTCPDRDPLELLNGD